MEMSIKIALAGNPNYRLFCRESELWKDDII